MFFLSHPRIRAKAPKGMRYYTIGFCTFHYKNNNRFYSVIQGCARVEQRCLITLVLFSKKSHAFF